MIFKATPLMSPSLTVDIPANYDEGVIESSIAHAELLADGHITVVYRKKSDSSILVTKKFSPADFKGTGPRFYMLAGGIVRNVGTPAAIAYDSGNDKIIETVADDTVPLDISVECTVSGQWTACDIYLVKNVKQFRVDGAGRLSAVFDA